MLIKRVILTETGTYNDVYNRPHTTTVKGDTLSRMQRLTDSGTNYSTDALSGVAGELMRPSAHVESAVLIPNGYGEARFRFMMEVEWPMVGGNTQVDVICGYTNYCGVSQNSNNMDPNMLLNLNSVTSITSYTRLDGMNRPYRDIHVRESNQILTSYFNPQQQYNQFYLAPQDVFDGITLNNTLGGLQDGRNIRTVDTRGASMEAPRLSRRSNNHGGSYMSRTLSAYHTALQKASVSDDNYANVMRSAKAAVVDTNAYDNLSLSNLLHHTDMQYTQTIRWAELLQICPDLEQRTTVAFNRGALVRSRGPGDALPTRGETEQWDTATNETVVATMIVNTIPTLMSEAKLTQIAFSATNQTMGTNNGTPYAVTVNDARSVSQMLEIQSPYMQDNIHAMVMRIATELMPAITFNNQMAATITCRCDIMGNTHIEVSLNGGPLIPYDNPQWSDSASAPVVTINQDNRKTLARDISSIMENLNTENWAQ